MISNNYVPQFFDTPFDHVSYTLVRNQDQFDVLFDDLSADEFLGVGKDCQVDFYKDSAVAVVQLGDTSERMLIQIFSLLLHEAVHIWQRVRMRMGESEPSKEFEAYSIQRIAQDLFWLYEQSETQTQ